MNDDIVDRLRALGDKLRYDWAGLNDPPVTVAEEAADEIVRLRRWKTGATYVLDAWQEAWELAGCPGNLGATKSEAMLDEITRLRAELEHEREQSDEWTKTLDAIDALHQPVIDSEWLVKRCEQCDMEWPCRTLLLLHPTTLDEAIDTLGTVHK